MQQHHHLPHFIVVYDLLSISAAQLCKHVGDVYNFLHVSIFFFLSPCMSITYLIEDSGWRILFGFANILFAIHGCIKKIRLLPFVIAITR